MATNNPDLSEGIAPKSAKIFNFPDVSITKDRTESDAIWILDKCDPDENLPMLQFKLRIEELAQQVDKSDVDRLLEIWSNVRSNLDKEYLNIFARADISLRVAIVATYLAELGAKVLSEHHVQFIPENIGKRAGSMKFQSFEVFAHEILEKQVDVRIQRLPRNQTRATMEEIVLWLCEILKTLEHKKAS